MLEFESVRKEGKLSTLCLYEGIPAVHALRGAEEKKNSFPIYKAHKQPELEPTPRFVAKNSPDFGSQSRRKKSLPRIGIGSDLYHKAQFERIGTNSLETSVLTRDVLWEVGYFEMESCGRKEEATKTDGREEIAPRGSAQPSE